MPRHSNEPLSIFNIQAHFQKSVLPVFVHNDTLYLPGHSFVYEQLNQVTLALQ